MQAYTIKPKGRKTELEEYQTMYEVVMVYVKVLSEEKCKNRRYLTYDEDFYVLLAMLFAQERGSINTVLEVIPLILNMEKAGVTGNLGSSPERTMEINSLSVKELT
jgi:hypothetical protein